MCIRSSVLLLLATGASSFVIQPPISQIKVGSLLTTSTSLEAKAKKKKKQKATTTNSGGFGSVVEKTLSKKDKESGGGGDYDAFPALQDMVKETIAPSTSTQKTVAMDLSKEMYERIGQIYSFNDFNYPAGWFNDDDADGDDASGEESAAPAEGAATTMSFDDLLTAGSSTNDKPTVTPLDLLGSGTGTGTGSGSGASGKVDDFADLIAGATGGTSTGSSITDTSLAGGAAGAAAAAGAIAVERKAEEIDAIQSLPPFTQFRILNVDPMVLAIDDFMSEEECDEYVNLCANPKILTESNDAPMESRSKTMGKDSKSKSQRTSTTWFHHFKGVPALMAKASRLLGLKSIDRWEEPQTVRYQQTEKFTWHLDALAPGDSEPEIGGQRVATLLVYLNDIGENNGGATCFRDLGDNFDDGDYLRVQPKKGSALLFFPAAGGIPNTPFDIRTLHAGEAVSASAESDKWIAQCWLRENNNYTPSAPSGNTHVAATKAIGEFCTSSSD